MDIRRKPEVELFIKASTIDGERKGSCIFCQKWFMVLFLKSKANELALTVTTVNMKQYPKEIKELTHSPPPIVLHEDLAMPEERIEGHLKAEFPDQSLFLNDPIAKEKILDVFSKFNHYLAAGGGAGGAAGAGEEQQRRARAHLVSELSKLDDYLGDVGSSYLCGEHVSLYDCELMPKLQHIRIAGKAYRGFDIPSTLANLWRYLDTAYHTEAFRESCPADQDIIAHYREKAKVRVDRTQEKVEALEAPTYTFTIPGGGGGGGGGENNHVGNYNNSH